MSRRIVVKPGCDGCVATGEPLLKPEHFQIFDLYALRQLRVSEVAEIMGVSAARIYLVKHRVAGLLKREIKELESKLV